MSTEPFAVNIMDSDTGMIASPERARELIPKHKEELTPLEEELLEALEYFVTAATSGAIAEPIYISVDKARAAIKKAKGE